MIWWVVIIISFIAGIATWVLDGYFSEGLIAGISTFLGLSLIAVIASLLLYVFQIGLTPIGTEKVPIDSVVIEGVTTDGDYEKIESDSSIYYREVKSGKLQERSRKYTIVKTDDTATEAYILKQMGEYNGVIKFVFGTQKDEISSEIYLPTKENKEKVKETQTEESSNEVYDLWE